MRKLLPVYLSAICCVIILAGWNNRPAAETAPPGNYKKQAVTVLRETVMREAAWAMQQPVLTVTAETSARSAGGRHDFYSEGDYWWPNPAHPDSPYIQRDGMTNPENFVAHRLAMIRFSKIIGALASAYSITRDDQYVVQAMAHLRGWFTDTATLMNPNLLYAQAIKGRFTGRGIGIIDTIQLMEVAQGVIVMQASKAFSKSLLAGVKDWFAAYLSWLTTHPYGIAEMNALNNHGTCWVMQVATFARLTGDTKLLRFCTQRYKDVLLPGQMATDGSFPLELKRTKPYGYSLFNLDAMTMICQVLSSRDQNLWNYRAPGGQSIETGIKYMTPFVQNKSSWPLPPDVMYWENWPVAHPFLLFGAVAYTRDAWFSTWQKLDHQPTVEEVIRNLPVRHPLIWLQCINEVGPVNLLSGFTRM